MNEYLTAVLNVAFNYNISYEIFNYLNDETPSAALPEERRIAINANWFKPNQLPFVVAHEIAHVINDDDGYLSFHANNKLKTEASANKTAIEILLHEYHRRNDDMPNYVQFMHDFEIPNDLEDCVKSAILDEYDCDYM
ncbi:ImmA/IrrE family metallo-endopeptidase [Secundilactobacillus kimchicus]|uniref:ImmA/IrrE family metallo-endopeptidase n=1 Tax=Secundilactobacillus kimchicus TaxID=528209 RepID=UPI001C0294CE